MSSTEPSMDEMRTRPVDVPEDVRAELDAEQRRTDAEPVVSTPIEQVPEDAIAERDLEARLGREDMRQRLSEGRPPAENEPRS
jgi:hypothetical protein